MVGTCTDMKDKLIKPGIMFTISEAIRIVNHIYNHCCIDPKDRFHNTFFHEICPILSIAEHVDSGDTRMVFTGADAQFDGLLHLKPGGQQKVEMTSAIDGQNDALQMELLDKQGYARAFVPIHASGTKKTRIFGPNESYTSASTGDYGWSTDEDGGSTDRYDCETLLPLLEQSLLRKIKKAKKNENYADGWLGIVFDDWVCPLKKAEKKKRFDPLCRRLLDGGRDQYAPFCRVFILGISRQYLFDSCET